MITLNLSKQTNKTQHFKKIKKKFAQKIEKISLDKKVKK